MATNPPNTLTRTSHSLSIETQAGALIGLINGWSPQQNRTITPIYELNPETSGDPLENIPGNVTGLQIQVNRYDLFTKRMEQAFGTADMQMLSDQNNFFLVTERWVYPNFPGGVSGGSEVWQYTGCWFSNIGRNYRSDGDRIVNVNATLMYVRRNKIA